MQLFGFREVVVECMRGTAVLIGGGVDLGGDLGLCRWGFGDVHDWAADVVDWGGFVAECVEEGDADGDNHAADHCDGGDGGAVAGCFAGGGGEVADGRTASDGAGGVGYKDDVVVCGCRGVGDVIFSRMVGTTEGKRLEI